ncbi:MAG: putative flagellar associated protein [Streblomastix strix]|uniref:Cytochrome b5 domain-containing protein 1 n=1 Tax=Streblomastix strix TaxID=222440 RepID=A0A5J4X2A3_9EUKA|nr:MAG: putative flagellar associated protein [Streblomastix strix]
MSNAQEQFVLPSYESDDTVRRLPRYFSAIDVANHNSSSDCWVSFLGKVYDLTPLISEFKNDAQLVNSFLEAAGRDISHWFNPKTGNIRTELDDSSGLTEPYTAGRKILHVLPTAPRTDRPNDFVIPWYKDEKYKVGFLTKKSRKIRLHNMLNHEEHILEVCKEETLGQIRARYLEHNAHAHSYTWKHLRRVLDMHKTLEDNGIPDEDGLYEEYAIDRDVNIPTLHLYYIPHYSKPPHLGCYFCSDVVAPRNSFIDRTLDQQCTVTRPGLAPIASALAVELLVCILHNKRGPYAKAGKEYEELHELKQEKEKVKENEEFDDKQRDEINSDFEDDSASMSFVPHQIRFTLDSFSMSNYTFRPFPMCTACSAIVRTEYHRRKFDFLLEVFNNPAYLETLVGLDKMMKKAEQDESERLESIHEGIDESGEGDEDEFELI